MSKIALVTGASSGIGKACALALLKEGWQVVLVGRRADALATAVLEAGANAGNAHAIPTDLSKEPEVKALFDQIRSRFGRLDLVFNNAGISLPYTLPGDLSGDEWRRAVDINLNGAFYTLSYAFKLMQEQSPQGGRIINNGSISAHVPRPGSIAYTATKHAISGLTRAASLDGRPYNIAVPGSHCPQCGHVLPWTEKIPVLSYLRLQGRCSQCACSIGWRDPAIELATAAVFVWSFGQYGLSSSALAR